MDDLDTLKKKPVSSRSRTNRKSDESKRKERANAAAAADRGNSSSGIYGFYQDGKVFLISETL